MATTHAATSDEHLRKRADKLRRLIKYHDIDQNELAGRLGFSRGYLNERLNVLHNGEKLFSTMPALLDDVEAEMQAMVAERDRQAA